MIVINLWGAPSAGKSTTAAGLFFLMKINKMRVELIHEFAKDLVLEGRHNVFGDQNYIFAEQARRTTRLLDHEYDFAITDSPLLLPLFYDRENKVRKKTFSDFVEEDFHQHNNINYLLQRRHSFESVGRRHTEEQSLRIEIEMKEFLKEHNIEYTEVDSSPKTPEIILKDIRDRMANPINHLPFDNLDDASLK